VSFFALGCPGAKGPNTPNPSGTKAESEGPLVWKMSKSGLGFRISNADEEADSASTARGRATPATPLSAADARKMLARMPELRADPEDEKDFALRAKSIPAPRPGKTIQEAFPPPTSAQAPQGGPASGPLKIERHAPDGKVDVAPHLTMTFSQPMVAL